MSGDTTSVTRCLNKKLPELFQKLPKNKSLQFAFKSYGSQPIAQKVTKRLGYF